ncbi:hypothetical protein, partial [Nocardia brasiliensis]|uniref:hypothetical protein n=1 Tax=Nocardia brasiliensis TaxID=37326 RepID=UPI0024557090
TDKAAWNGGLAALSAGGVAELTTSLAPLVRRVRETVLPPGWLARWWAGGGRAPRPPPPPPRVA